MSIRKLLLTMLGASGVLACGFLYAGSSALALTFSRQVGGFVTPRALAVTASGDLYVADAGEAKIDEYGPAGEVLEPITGFEKEGTLETFGTLQGVATDGTGDLYVSDSLHKAVYKLSPSGALEFELLGPDPEAEEDFGSPKGLAVDNSTSPLTDPSAGDIYVTDSINKAVYKFSSSGKLESTLLGPNPGAEEDFGSPRGVAVAPDGDLYVADSLNHAVYKFSPTGAYESTLLGPNPGAGEDFESPRGLAIDESGDLYVADFSKHIVYEFDATGKFLTEITGVPAGAAPVSGPFSGTEGLEGPVGLAVDSAGDLYVADTGDKVVDEFSLLPPTVLVNQATSVTRASATLTGSVNPHGATVTSCKFEYGVSGPAEHSIPCSGPPVGSGEETVPVSAQITGLAANTVYRYRLVIESARGVSVSKSISKDPEEQEFTTSAAPPEVLLAEASEVEQFGATLTGTINPNTAPASYHFLYVEESKYEPSAADPYGAGVVAPIPDLYTPVNGTPDVIAPQKIAGLQPETTYHFALVATGPGGTVTGADKTFTTPGIPPALVSTGSAVNISEGAVTLTGTINPQGWSTVYTFRYGTSTAYGASWPTVPITLGSLSGQQNITVFLENLQPSTTYHYQLVASNGGHTTFGEDRTFTTSAYPTSVIQETPALKVSLGINPEEKPKTNKKTKKSVKHKAKHKSKKKKKAKGKKK